MTGRDLTLRIRQNRLRRLRAGGLREGTPIRRLSLSLSGLFSLLLAGLAVAGALGYASLAHDLPSIEILPGLLEPPDGLFLQPTRLYDRTGTQVLLTLQSPATAGATYLRWAPGAGANEPDLLPTSLVTATLAAADPGFWRHPGFVLDGLGTGIHPTLAQQLVADLLLADEPAGLRRDLRERLLAAQVTGRFGQAKVLEWYLNNAHFGRLAFGADAAARLYLDKPAVELTLAEATLLAATLRTPGLNPLDAPQAALENQKALIQEMLQRRMISPAAGVQAALAQLALRPADQPGLQPHSLAPAFTRLALSQLETQMPRWRIERGGLNLITSLDSTLQSQAECALQVQLKRLAGDASPAATLAADCPLAGQEAARRLPTPPYAVALPAGSLQAEAIILDPTTGQVLALVGQPPGVAGQTAALPAHPAGTLVTPLIYLTALTRGLSPATLVWDVPASSGNGLANFDGQYHGPVRLRLAAANDYLPPAASVLAQVGADNVLHLAQQLGLEKPAALQVAAAASPLEILRPVDLLEISRLFGVLANQGLLAGRILVPGDQANGRTPLIEPVSLLRLEDGRGRVLQDWQQVNTRPILSPQVAYVLNHVFSDEPARWPSLGHPNPLEVGRPAAVKVSRTASADHLWTIGYTPQLVVGVWLGQAASNSEPAIQPQPAPALQHAVAGLWHALLQTASQDLPYRAWSAPAGINTLAVCDPSGDLPGPDCPNVVAEIFLPGSEPVQVDRLYRRYEINRESGRLATIFTPPDLVRSQVFLLVPVEAALWAQQAGLQPPPVEYDQVPLALPAHSGLAITSPAMFAAVRGQVIIQGQAAGEAFDSYRLQVGPGLNPREWLLIGEDHYQPVSEGKLGAWDTRGLDGLYALQLLVTRKDQSAERVTVLVTVDNQLPELQIRFPAAGQRLDIINTASLVFRLAVEDNLGIESVSVYLDGRLLGVLLQPPYALPWQPVSGAHSLRVIAFDLAGNTQEARLEFSVP